MTAPGLYPEHDVFIPIDELKNTLRWMRGEDLITHLGLDTTTNGQSVRNLPEKKTLVMAEHCLLAGLW